MVVVRALGAAALVVVTVLACNSCVGEDPPFTSSSEADAAPPASSEAPDAAPAVTAEDACKANLPASRACYTGPEGTRGKGICKDGELTCLASGDSTCTGEVQPAAQDVCNDLDDDCNGVVDDGIDKMKSPLHCGGCNKPCAADEACSGGVCYKRNETSCTDGTDNDGDGAADCADTECDQQSCGTGCTCKSNAKSETICNDGDDNDKDGTIDCADSDCTTCGVGCTCTAGAKSETICNDGVDNDGDGLSDCADPDCPNCGAGCTCSGVTKTETACTDGSDNDKDGKTDCGDPDCNGKSCGTGCVCANADKSETNCSDGVDNDGDGKKDCADSDCAMKPCTKAGGLTGTCKSNVCQ